MQELPETSEGVTPGQEKPEAKAPRVVTTEKPAPLEWPAHLDNHRRQFEKRQATPTAVGEQQRATTRPLQETPKGKLKAKPYVRGTSRGTRSTIA